MFDIITFGSATWDIFVKPNDFKKIDGQKFLTGKGICFDLGSKVDIGEVNFSTGGGGTNSAATFANQGIKVAYCGKIGDDISGNEILEELKRRKINIDFVAKTNLKSTNHSIVINATKEERTILVYRGASELLSKKEIPFKKLDAKWIYLAPLSGKLCHLFGEIVNFAKKKDIKVAANLGNSQLCLKKELLGKILKKLDILVLNQEEASILTNIPYSQENLIFKKIDEMCDGIAIMTKGEEGVSVSDGENIYKAKSPNLKVIDKTGAGDAFSSGFVSAYIKSKGDIEYSIQFGMANAKSCIEKWGAKAGLISYKSQFKKVKVIKEHCLENNLCQVKK